MFKYLVIATLVPILSACDDWGCEGIPEDILPATKVTVKYLNETGRVQEKWYDLAGTCSSRQNPSYTVILRDGTDVKVLYSDLKVLK